MNDNNNDLEELFCDYCETPVETEDELTATKWTGNLCETCMEEEVWK